MKKEIIEKSLLKALENGISVKDFIKLKQTIKDNQFTK